MIFGFNTEIEHRGEKFHVQTEDRGIQRPVIETLVYKGGEIVFSRKINYSSLIGKKDFKERVREKLKNQHEKIIDEIKNGLHDELLGFDTDETQEKDKEVSESPLQKAEKEENEIREKRINKILNLIEEMPEDFFYYRYYNPFIVYSERDQILLITGKIEDIKKSSPIISTKVFLEIRDKKQNSLISAETKTNFYGEYRIQLFCSKEKKPHWLSIKLIEHKISHSPVLFPIKS